MEALFISINAKTCVKYPPEFVKHHNLTLLCDSDCLSLRVFKPKWSNYATFRWPPKPCISEGDFEAPCLGFVCPRTRYSCYMYVSLLSKMYVSSLNQLSSKNSGSSLILFLFTGTSQHILSDQLVWVFTLSGSLMGADEDPWSEFFAMKHMKNLALGYVFGWVFLDSSQQILSLYLQEFLHSASWQNWVLLHSCWTFSLIL